MGGSGLENSFGAVTVGRLWPDWGRSQQVGADREPGGQFSLDHIESEVAQRVEQNVDQGKGSCLVIGGPGSISEGWGRLGEGSYRFPCGSVSVDYLFWESENERKESLDAAPFFFFFFFLSQR